MKSVALFIAMFVLIASPAYALDPCNGVEHAVMMQHGGAQACCELDREFHGHPVDDPGAGTTTADGSLCDLCSLCSDDNIPASAGVSNADQLIGKLFRLEILPLLAGHTVPLLKPPQS